MELFEYDPNRSANLARLVYKDGERRFILQPEKLQVGDQVVSDDSAPIRTGNALPIGKIPVGTEVHNVELIPGRGAQFVRTAGSAAGTSARGRRLCLSQSAWPDTKSSRGA